MLSPAGANDPFFSPNIKKDSKFKKNPGNLIITSPINNNKSSFNFKNLQTDKTKDNMEENKMVMTLNAVNVPSSPMHNGDKNKIDATNKQTNLESFKVFVRIRPVNSKELTITNKKVNTFSKSVQRIDETTLKLVPLDHQFNLATFRDEKYFNFDAVFDENDSTLSIFQKTVLLPISNLFSGFNSTILAYGMTGAGKTHTMMGNIYENATTNNMFNYGNLPNYPTMNNNEAKNANYYQITNNMNNNDCKLNSSPFNNIRNNSENEIGLIFLTIDEIFNRISSEKLENPNFEYIIKFSYLEIYNEQVKDLLVDQSENLMILEDQLKGIIMPDLREVRLECSQEVSSLLETGNRRRTMASTSSNQFSSRSHAILIINLEKKNLKASNQIIFAKFFLVDLAGSERALISENKGGLRMTEGANINRSLLALGNCINILSDSNKKGAFVPYRDSKLTRLLKESLGGNTKTIMIACLSPAGLNYEETLNTIKYANRAKNIKRKINKNVREVDDIQDYKEIIEGLKGEIDFLKLQLLDKKNRFSPIRKVNNENLNININPILFEKIEAVSQKILINLEEHWEIKQSLCELKTLKNSNEKMLAEKKRRLAFEENASGEILEEIRQLEDNMGNNNRILEQMEMNLGRVKMERERLYQEMVNVNENQGGNRQYGEMKLVCENLNREVISLQAVNEEMRRKEMDNNRIQDEKDLAIREMQKELELMKRKLDEKDKIIEENIQIIQSLSSTNEFDGLRKIKNYRSNTSENMNQLKKLVLKFEQVGLGAEEKSHIRQYFKPKSTGNFNSNLNINLNLAKNIPNSTEINNNPTHPKSNRSNYDKSEKRINLEKLSECSSLTRFEVANNTKMSNPIEEFTLNQESKNGSKIIPKKIIESLSEVSSIFLEDNPNFSVSVEILEDLKKKSFKDESNFNISEKKRSSFDDSKLIRIPKEDLKLDGNPFAKKKEPLIPVDIKEIKDNSLDELKEFRESINFLVLKVLGCPGGGEYNKTEILNEISGLFQTLELKKFNLEEAERRQMQTLKEYQIRNSKISEKARSASANATKSPLNSLKIENNIITPHQKMTSLTGNTGFLRNSTEKGFYDSIEKSKKKALSNMAMKCGSINLQDETKRMYLKEKIMENRRSEDLKFIKTTASKSKENFYKPEILRKAEMMKNELVLRNTTNFK